MDFLFNKKNKTIRYVLDKYKEDILWLQHNTEPWATVIKKWNDTYAVRRNSSAQTVTEFIKEWSIMNDLRSNVLVSRASQSNIEF